MLTIRSQDGTIRNAVYEATRIACAKIVCGACVWNVRKVWDGKTVTIQQALEAVNSQYDVAPFAWQDARLTAICGANVAPFDLKKIPCVETVDGISIGWDDITKPLAFDKICFGVMDADAFILNDRWAELSRGGQAKVVARLKEDDKNAHVQYLIGILYEGGLGVKQSHVGAVKWLRKFDEVWDARGKSKKPISIREAIKKELGNLFEELGKRVF